MSDDSYIKVDNGQQFIPKINKIKKVQFDKLCLVDGMMWPDCEGNICVVENGKWVKLKKSSDRVK